MLKDFDQFREKNFQEKIYLHTDKSVYVTGEILWCKAYVTDAHLHHTSDISKVAYLELYDNRQKPVWQASISLDKGKGEGSLVIPSSVITGNYVLRCYTNWMKNQEAGFYFEKSITLINPLKKPVIDTAQKQEYYDAAFFPEGGHLVSGLPAQLAFRMRNNQGKNPEMKGWLIAGQTDTIAKLDTKAMGMGAIKFTPENGKNYHAAFQLPDGSMRDFTLPDIEDQGYTMQLIENVSGLVTVTVNTNIRSNNNQCYLLVHCRQTNLKALTVGFQNGKATFSLLKNELSDGISHFTVFNENGVPVLERLFFKKPEKLLQLKLQTDKEIYNAREKVTLSLDAKLPTGLPADASFSLSVLKMDSLETIDEGNIVSYLYLQSDIPEKIESPGKYLSPDKGNEDQLNNLILLIYGWRRFNWNAILEKTSTEPRYIPEYSGQVISAKMTDKNGVPAVAGKTAFAAIPGNRYEMSITRTNDKGDLHFLFNRIKGTSILSLQPDIRTDSSMQILLQSPYSSDFSANKSLPFRFSEKDTTVLSNIIFESQLHTAFRRDDLFAFQSQLSNDTTSFFGLPEKNYNLDEYTRFGTLEEVFREYIPEVGVRKNRGNFKLNVINLPYKAFFNEDPLILLDGVPVTDINKVMAFEPQQVKNISVVPRRFYLSGLTFPGIISFQTYNGDLGSFNLDPRILLVDFEGLQVNREFYSPQYTQSTIRGGTMPDLRRLLHWSPEIRTDVTGKALLSFYTSDIKGKYAILLEGIHEKGIPGSVMKVIEVR